MSADPHLTNRGIRLRRLVVVALSLCLALMVAELLTRIVKPELGWVQLADPYLGWSSREYRELEPRPRSRPDVKRVLFLGDSYLAGWGVGDLDERFPVVLAERLGGDHEVAILATGGWGTDQQLLAYMERGAPWKPDLVVVAFCANNDLADITTHHRRGRKLKPYFVLTDDGELALHDGEGNPVEQIRRDRPPIPMLHRSHLFRLIRSVATSRDERPAAGGRRAYDPQAFPAVDDRYKRLRRRRARLGEVFVPQGTLSWSPQGEVGRLSAYLSGDFEMNRYQWRLLEALLGRLREAVRSVGGRLAVLMLPVSVNPADITTVAGGSYDHRFETPSGPVRIRTAEPKDRLGPICDRVGASFIDPSASFIEQVEGRGMRDQIWPDPQDWHFSAAGHELLAQIIEPQLRAELATGE